MPRKWFRKTQHRKDKELAKKLLLAADIIDRQGLCAGRLVNDQGEVCVVGALALAEGYTVLGLQVYDAASLPTVLVLKGYINDLVTWWSDTQVKLYGKIRARGRVTCTLRELASKYA